MNRLLLLPIKLPLRIVALQLRVARGAAELGLDVARELADAAPWAERGGRGGTPAAGPQAAPSLGAGETTPTPDPGGPPPRTARPARSPRPGRTKASTDGRAATAARATRPKREAAPKAKPKPKPKPKPRAARAPKPTPEPEPRPRRAARKASGDKPAPEPGPGPELHVAEPWPGYDAMALDEVLGRLRDADETQLAVVALYESQHENRQAILLACETPEP